jgi:hypothetical protein
VPVGQLKAKLADATVCLMHQQRVLGSPEDKQDSQPTRVWTVMPHCPRSHCRPPIQHLHCFSEAGAVGLKFQARLRSCACRGLCIFIDTQSLATSLTVPDTASPNSMRLLKSDKPTPCRPRHGRQRPHEECDDATQLASWLFMLQLPSCLGCDGCQACHEVTLGRHRKSGLGAW